MKKILTLILCFALICSLSVSSFAAGTPEPIYSNDSLLFYDIGNLGSEPVDTFFSISSPSIGVKPLYFLIDDVFYAFSPFYFEADEPYYFYGDMAVFGGDLERMTFVFIPNDSLGTIALPCTDCADPTTPHPHSIAIYDEYPFASSAPASDAPAFIAATGDGFKMMNSITAGIMSNPVLLFLLAASLIPVGIALFKALKNAASRK